MSAKERFAALLTIMTPDELSELRDVFASIPAGVVVNPVRLAEEVHNPRPTPYEPQKQPRPIGPRLYRELIGEPEPPKPRTPTLTPSRKPRRRRRLTDIVQHDEHESAEAGLLSPEPTPSAAPTSKPRSSASESRRKPHPPATLIPSVIVPRTGPR